MNKEQQFFEFYIKHYLELNKISENIDINYNKLQKIYTFDRNFKKYTHFRFDYRGWMKQTDQWKQSQENWNYNLLSNLIKIATNQNLGDDFNIIFPINYEKFLKTFSFYDNGILEFDKFKINIYLNENVEDIRIGSSRVVFDGIDIE